MLQVDSNRRFNFYIKLETQYYFNNTELPSLFQCGLLVYTKFNVHGFAIGMNYPRLQFIS